MFGFGGGRVGGISGGCVSGYKCTRPRVNLSLSYGKGNKFSCAPLRIICGHASMNEVSKYTEAEM